MVRRICNLSKTNSFFVFGARGTGKSTLLREHFSKVNHVHFDLLNPDLEAEFQLHPGNLTLRLEQIKKDNPECRWIVLDEIQKAPALLNLVHLQIEQKYFYFALTGSSARKLKRGQANLLAGRAHIFHLFPFSALELKEQFELHSALRWGTLPSQLGMVAIEKSRYLKSYTNTYLKEEVVAEQLVRNLVPFRAFLEVAAQSSGKIINYSKIARDVNVESPTVQSYFDILEETYIGFRLLPFHESIRKRQTQHPKFYFFDNGVQRALSRRIDLDIAESTYEYGELFESFLIQEVFRLISYQEKEWTMSYLMTKDGVEVDLIIDRPGLSRVFIEIKSTKEVQNEDAKNLIAILTTQKKTQKGSAVGYVFSQDPKSFIRDGISYLPWQKGLVEIGLGVEN
jgi:predicted AAA+ superfamily ATPase